ncbi:MAG: hypothetical protein HY814_09485 [Candidatus Riflebacteria bacterium]|nr:hypothetical protein [Candidatus Riflebacteria bacterium]
MSRTAVAEVVITVRPEGEIPIPAVWLSQPSATGQYFEGLSVTFSASALSLKDGFLTPPATAWRSDRQGFLDSQPSFTCTSLSPGIHQLVFSATDSLGRTASQTVTITVRPQSEIPPPTVYLAEPRTNGMYYEGLPVVVSGWATDLVDGWVGGEGLSWASDRQGPIASGGSSSVTTLATGQHVLLLEARNSRGQTGVTTVAILIRPVSEIPVPAVQVSSPSPGSTWWETVAIPASAFARVLADGALTVDRIEWTSDRQGTLGNGTSLSLSGLATGPHVLTVAATSSRGTIGITTVSITVRPLSEAPPPGVAILSPAWGNAYRVGKPLPLSGWGNDAVDGLLSGPALRWTVEGLGEVGTGTSASFVPPIPGDYVVRLTAAASRGASSAVSQSVAAIDLPVGSFPSCELTAPASGTTVTAGETLQLSGEAYDLRDGPLHGEALQWSSDLQGALGQGQSPWVRFTRVGLHRVVLLASNFYGGTGVDSIEVNVQPSTPQVVLSQPYEGQRFERGDQVALRASAHDLLDGEMPPSAVSWFSNLHGQLGSGVSTAVCLVLTGTDVLTLVAVNSLGVAVQATVSITIAEPSPPMVDMLCPNTWQTYYDDAPVPFRVNTWDSREGVVPDERIAWSDNVEEPLGQGDEFSRPLARGPHVVRVVATNSRGVSCEVTRAIEIHDASVLPPPVVQIQRPFAGQPLYATVLFALNGNANDALGRSIDGEALVWSSSLDGPLGVGSVATAALSTGHHRVSLEARDWRARVSTAAVELEVASAETIPPPQVQIASPPPGALFYETMPIWLYGTASDVLDGSLSGSRLQWLTGDGRTLGEGDPVVTTLPANGYVVRLEAHASRERISVATVPFLVLPLEDAPPPQVSILTPWANHAIPRGQTAALWAVGQDLIDGALPPEQFTWHSEALPGPVTGASVVTTFDGLPGLYVLHVDAGTSRGTTGTASRAIALVDPQSEAPPVVRILAPAPGTVLPFGSQVVLRAEAFSEGEGVIGGCRIVWSDPEGNMIYLGNEVTWSARPPGSGVLRAVALDGQNRSGEATVAVSVLPPTPTVTIVQPADGWTLLPGETLTLQAQAGDGAGGWLDGSRIRWE